MKKPSLPTRYDEPGAWGALRTIVDTVLGRRGNELPTIVPRKLSAAGAPTQAEYDALAVRVLQLEKNYELLRHRLDD